MNYDLEKLNEIRALRREMNRLNWWVWFVSLFFVIPACTFVIWFSVSWVSFSLSVGKDLEKMTRGMK